MRARYWRISLGTTHVNRKINFSWRAPPPSPPNKHIEDSDLPILLFPNEKQLIEFYLSRSIP
jgi:hypothetical protein